MPLQRAKPRLPATDDTSATGRARALAAREGWTAVTHRNHLTLSRQILTASEAKCGQPV